MALPPEWIGFASYLTRTKSRVQEVGVISLGQTETMPMVTDQTLSTRSAGPPVTPPGWDVQGAGLTADTLQLVHLLRAGALRIYDRPDEVYL